MAASIPVRYTSRAGAGGTTSKPVGYGTSSPLSALLAGRAFGSGSYPPPSIANEYAGNPQTAAVSSAPAAPTSFNTAIPNSPAAAGLGDGSIDFSTDPILQRVTALARQNAQQAAAGADAAAKQAFINSGFGDVARKYRYGAPADELLGLGDTQSTGDESTALAAEQNPYSVAALLGKAHSAQNVGIDQNQNLQNLFYSSNRANLLGDEATNYLGKQYGAQQDLAGQLSGIAQQLIQARQGAEGQVLGESENAYMRALANAQAAGASSGGTFPGGFTASQINTAQGAPLGSQIRQVDTTPRSLESTTTPGSYLRALMLRSQGMNQRYGLGG